MLKPAVVTLLICLTPQFALAVPQVFPTKAVLAGPEASQQLVVWKEADGARHDLTRQATYESTDVKIVTVSAHGQLTPVGEGRATVHVLTDGTSLSVPVEVRALDSPAPVSFRQQVQPILTKATCNSGGCHGKAEGQNGFKLSIFAFDSEADHTAIAREGRGRRLSPAAPHESLILRKATAATPHGGGQKLTPDGLWYRRIARWISEGGQLDAPKQESSNSSPQLQITPADAILSADNGQQLQVFLLDEMGQRHCVTREVEYFSNDPAVAKVDEEGWVQVSDVPGEAAILVRHLGQVAVCRVTLPKKDQFQRPPENNPIDAYVWDRLERLGIAPSELAQDGPFLRRVYLDIIGTLPTADEAEQFLNSDDPNKRSAIVDDLLNRPEYGDFWAMRWADSLRLDQEIVKAQATVAMTRWLRRQFIENRPYDEIVREIISVRGNTHSEAPAAFFSVHKDAEMLGRSVSQVFLGVRIECAQCHHHPFEKWGQQDYYAFSSFFTGIGRKGTPGGGTKIFDQAGTDLEHPRTKQPVAAAGLGAEPAELGEGVSRRAALADWMTRRDNPFLARMIVNRLWAHYFGRGLVEPIDDIRATNPPTNPALMDFLTNNLIDSGYDLKAFTKMLVTSRAYQLSSQANASNQRDHQNYSHTVWKPIPAEVLLDAICQVTAISEKFNGWPEGYRAIEVWDNRMPSYFFRVFGKPQRVSTCECERGNEPSIAQALHLMNSTESVEKIRHRNGRAARLAKSNLNPDQIITQLYLATLTRYPSDDETRLMREAFADANTPRRQATEDVMWTLLNTREFVFNH